MKKRGTIFVISGPSGSGKTTLARRLLSDKGLSGKLARSISYTTRPKRTGERDGKDYYFVSKGDFQRGLKAKKFLEWTRYLGYYYGTTRDFVEDKLKKGKNLVLCVDLNGEKSIKKIYPENTVSIFVMPASLSDLPKRISKRCKHTKGIEIKKRLVLAAKEMLHSRRYDYRLVNKDLEKAAGLLKEIVLKHIQRKS